MSIRILASLSSRKIGFLEYKERYELIFGIHSLHLSFILHYLKIHLHCNYCTTGEADGIRGLKSLGVRDLTYRLAFLACSVASTNPQFGGKDLVGDDVTAETIKKQMTEQEWHKIYEMSQDRNLYHNLVSSMFPTIHGK